ncbi:MAG: hypothetical protein WCK98_07395 [bacterium]
MKFNRYIFDLYLESNSGKKSLNIWGTFLDWENWDSIDLELLVEQINTTLYSKEDVESFRGTLELVRDEFLITIFKNKKLKDSAELLDWEYYKTEIANKFGFKTDQEVIKDAKLFWEDQIEETILGDGKDRDEMSNIE